MQNLLLDCKKIFITFALLTLIMLVGAESIGIVVELGFYCPSTYFSHNECLDLLTTLFLLL